jgi:hypothetical protein
LSRIKEKKKMNHEKKTTNNGKEKVSRVHKSGELAELDGAAPGRLSNEAWERGERVNWIRRMGVKLTGVDPGAEGTGPGADRTCPEALGAEAWSGGAGVESGKAGSGRDLAPQGLDRFANLGRLGLDGVGAPGGRQSGAKQARNG